MDKNSLTGAILIVLIWIVFSIFFLNSGNENKQETDRKQFDTEQDIFMFLDMEYALPENRNNITISKDSNTTITESNTLTVTNDINILRSFINVDR